MAWFCSTNPIMDMRTRSCPSVAGTTPFLKHLQFRLPLQFRLHLPIIPISSSSSHQQLARIHNPTSYNSGQCDFKLSRWFNISWRWTSSMISMYLICLCLDAKPHDDQFSSLNHPCEDVQNYYAGVQHLSGEALKKKLNIIIAKHQSLPYKKC